MVFNRTSVKLAAVITVAAAIATGCNIFHNVVGLSEVVSESSVVTPDNIGLMIIAHAPGKAKLTMSGWFNHYPVNAVITITVRATNR